jgi:hypothetical protein
MTRRAPPLRAPRQASTGSANTAQDSSIKVIRTNPSAITLHTIEDHELTTLANMSRPYSLAFATTALGALLALTPNVLDIIGHRKTGLSMAEVETLLLAGACLAGAIIFGVVAARGVIEANRTIKAIRSRPASPA